MGYSQTIPNRRRTIAFVAVLILHAIILWALFFIALSYRTVQETEVPIDVVLIQKSPIQKSAPDVPLPRFVVPPLPIISPPEIVIEAPPAPSDIPVTSASSLDGPPKVGRAAKIVWPRPDPRHPLARPSLHGQTGAVSY